jgi:ArsR family transcriptional regulator, arsenate/arsenite/antimonite-responsive transcriptional repressor
MKKSYENALAPEWVSVSKVFSALGDEQRQRILLLFERDERLNISQIVNASPLSRSAISHHLRVLHDAGVMRSEKVGKEVFFWIDAAFLKQTLGDVLTYMQENH